MSGKYLGDLYFLLLADLYFRFNATGGLAGRTQGLWKPSDSGAPVNFPASEMDKLRSLPVWKTLSGKRIAVERNVHFSLGAREDVANLPLPPGALDR